MLAAAISGERLRPDSNRRDLTARTMSVVVCSLLTDQMKSLDSLFFDCLRG